MYIFLITLFGFILRIINIIKPEGLWNDEYVSWMISAMPFSQGFFQEILKQCHMPLYYLYLKPFAGMSDVCLRLTSVIPSVLAVPVMYLVGMEYSTRCAKYAAVITAILPFLIYYSQEVRFYSILFLLSALVLLFMVRLLKNQTKKNTVFYAIFSLLLIFTHVLGIFYISLTTAYLIYKKKNINKKILIITICTFLLVTLAGMNILKQRPSAQWWGIFSYTNIMFLFSDFLSPVLSNNINAPPVFFYNTNTLFILLITIPTLIGLSGFILGLKKIKGLVFISLCFVFIISVIAACGKLVFITKYLTEILPVIILGIAAGFDGENKIKKTLFYLFVLINVFAIFTQFYPTKIVRNEGHRLPAVILNKQNPDRIIFTYYAPDRFSRYLKSDSEKLYISKINRMDYIENPSKILNNIKSGESVSIVFLDSVSFIPENLIDESIKRNLPEMFVTFSVIRHSLENTVRSDYKDVTSAKLGSWTVINGIKK